MMGWCKWSLPRGLRAMGGRADRLTSLQRSSTDHPRSRGRRDVETVRESIKALRSLADRSLSAQLARRGTRIRTARDLAQRTQTNVKLSLRSMPWDCAIRCPIRSPPAVPVSARRSSDRAAPLLGRADSSTCRHREPQGCSRGDRTIAGLTQPRWRPGKQTVTSDCERCAAWSPTAVAPTSVLAAPVRAPR